MKRTGVIVGVDLDVTPAQVQQLCDAFKERFPGVTFVVASGCNSVAFEWDDTPPAKGYPT